MTIAAVGAGVAAAATVASTVNSLVSSSGGVSGAQSANGQTLAANKATVDSGVNQSNAYLQPYQDAGTQALGNLSSGVNGGSLNSPMTDAQYQASPLYTPMVNDLASLQATPGYQFQLQQGLQSVNNSAAANGSLLSGATLQGINNYAQGQASTGYQAAWQRAQQAYQQAFTNNQSSQNQRYTQLQALANNGQQAANGMSANTMNGVGMEVGSQTNYGNNAGSLSLAQGQLNSNAGNGLVSALNQGIGAYSTLNNSPSISNTNLGGVGMAAYNPGSLGNSINSLGNASNYSTSALTAAGLL